MSCRLLPLLCFGLFACEGVTPRMAPEPVVPAAPQPSALVVLVVVDQLGTMHLDRLPEGHSGGFARLLTEDAWRGMGVMPHAKTETCPGHVTLATGAAPAVHGIPSNRFMVDGKKTYCGSLSLLRAQSIGDVFSKAGGEVVALSLKDRAAMFLGGRSPTLAAWVDRSGVMVQRPAGSEEAVPVEPPLVTPEQVTAWLSESWTPLDASVLEASGLPDSSAHEADPGMGTAFPKTPAIEAMPDNLGRALKLTPAGGTFLTEAALAAVARFKLGTDATPDLLTVSYSHFDGIGHTNTPESRESLDTLLRLDLELARLMSGLDTTVGKDRWSLVLTADHGAPPVAPKYVDLEKVPERLAPLLEKAGMPTTVTIDGHGIWLDASLDTDGVVAAVPLVEAVVADMTGVEAVVVPAAVTADTPFAEAYTAGVVPGRSTQIELLLAENYVALYAPSGPRGTDHGSPRDYDREVPLLAIGPGVTPGTGRTDTRTIAPSLATMGGLTGPADATAAPGPYVVPMAATAP